MKHSGVIRNMRKTQHMKQNTQSILFSYFSFKVCGSVTLFLLHLILVELVCTFTFCTYDICQM